MEDPEDYWFEVKEKPHHAVEVTEDFIRHLSRTRMLGIAADFCPRTGEPRGVKVLGTERYAPIGDYIVAKASGEIQAYYRQLFYSGFERVS